MIRILRLRGVFFAGPAGDLDYIREWVAKEKKSARWIPLEKKRAAWRIEALQRFPHLRVDYKKVPDDQNGFLQMLLWQKELASKESIEDEEGPDDQNGFLQMLVWQKEFASKESIEDEEGLWKQDLPAEFLPVISTKSGSSLPESFKKIDSYLNSKNKIIERAMRIGLLPEQSIPGVSRNNPLSLLTPDHITFVRNISQHLALKAILEAEQGDEAAALTTLKAMNGLAMHYSKIEITGLFCSTLGLAAEIQTREIAYWRVLPLLSNHDLSASQWIEFFHVESDIHQRLLHMFRGEWHVNTMGDDLILAAIPGDPIDFLNAWTDTVNHIVDPVGGHLYEWDKKLKSPLKLSIGNRGLHKLMIGGFPNYIKGLLSAYIKLKQYDLAFALHSLEREGQNLDNLGSAVIASLPVEIRSDIRLSIDFDKRMISLSAPEGKNPGVDPLPF